jgi:endoglucanase
MKNSFLVLSAFFCSLYFYLPTKAQVFTDLRGVNLTGCERVWEDRKLNSKHAVKNIEKTKQLGFNAFRIPLAVDDLIKKDRRFLRELRKLVRHTEATGTHLVLAYFQHDLDDQEWENQAERLAVNWLKLLEVIPKGTQNLYLELANEPQLNPENWAKAAELIIQKIRTNYSEIPIIIGATNYNSLFELSRTEPLAFENLIYTFHYYEPYIFSHQGAEWTGKQSSTTGIPYPFNQDKMPEIHPSALGTDGEINFRDYDKTGNLIAVEDKISQIASWAEKHQVMLYCTEYGVTQNADKQSRINYINDVTRILKKYQIPGFVWEWGGNFGISEIATELK